jgi:cytochrome c(L)
VTPADKVPKGAEVARTIVEGGAALMPEGGPVTFLHPLDNTVIRIDMMPNDTVTPAVKEFRDTAKNPYAGQQTAITEGKAAYEQWCAGCHLADGTGRIGSNLTDAEVRYPRVATDVGEFEVIYAGASGAMQPFGDRIPQDTILKVIAFLDTLKKK